MNIDSVDEDNTHFLVNLVALYVMYIPPLPSSDLYVHGGCGYVRSVNTRGSIIHQDPRFWRAQAGSPSTLPLPSNSSDTVRRRASRRVDQCSRSSLNPY